MSEQEFQLMKLAIEESEKSKSEDKGIHPKVGAVLTDDKGMVLLTSHRGETGRGDHAEFILLNKAEAEHINLANTHLYVTLEPCTARGPDKIPCAERILKSGIKKIYIGSLDSNPIICGQGENFLRGKLEVERFPGTLTNMIHQINETFVQHYKQKTLPQNSLYVKKQIPEIIVDYFNREGYQINIPFNWDINSDDVINYIKLSGAFDNKDMEKLFNSARGYAFDKKYSDYKYDQDVRGLDDSWDRKLVDILKNFNLDTLNKLTTINVGIGNGEEGKNFYKDIEDLILVDIAPISLEKAVEIYPKCKKLIAPAENLSEIPSLSIDVYLSFRTYQSSYFSKSKALREAYRILKIGGVLIISIANGFLGESKALIPGLIATGTSIIDKNKPFEILDSIRKKITNIGFEDVGINSSKAELFIYARKSR